MKITRQDRNAAMDVCSVAASNPPGSGKWWQACDSLGVRVQACNLAEQALIEGLRRYPDHQSPMAGAEAQALIATGWSP